MPQKSILVPARLWRSPATGWSWVDRRFMREYAVHLLRDAVLLHFFVAAVADKRGLSFYRDATMAALLGMTLLALISARSELLARDLIAHETHWTQVLSLPPPENRRYGAPGSGPMPLGEILRQAIASTHPDPDGSLP
jgi:hypothetical protein